MSSTVHRRHGRLVRAAAAGGAMTLTAGLLVACSNGESDEGIERADAPSDPIVAANEAEGTEGFLQSAQVAVVAEAGMANEARAAAIGIAAGAPVLTVAFPEGQSAFPDEDGDGIPDDAVHDPARNVFVRPDGTEYSFPEGDTLLWTMQDPDAATQAASLKAVGLGETAGVPAAEVEEELKRLGATTVLTVGDPEFTPAEGAKVYEAPAEAGALGDLLGVEVTEQALSTDPARMLSDMDPEAITVPPAAKAANDVEYAPADLELPKQSGAGDDGVVVFSAPGTPPALVATARAGGHEVMWLPAPDPRANSASVGAVREGRTPIGLGPAFGDSEKMKQTTEIAANEDVQELNLAGGGLMVFPGRRMVATYGHPGAPQLGVMGEETPEEAVAHVKDLVGQYDPLVEEPVVPAFEVISSVAQADAGPDGLYTLKVPPADLRPYIDAITEAGGYAIIDLQPGREDFLEQAKFYEELLKLPNVGLALDSEWKLHGDQVPMQQIGSVNADEVNRVADWLAELTRENNLPQKMFLLHQFRLDMLPDRQDIDTSHPELSYVLHADGHGTAGEKLETWNVMKQDLQPEIFLAWKNFYDEDKPMFTPEQTMNVDPTPWLVTYQ
ncbi:hypothetical protein [Corynebacterium sp. 335C]